MASIKGYSIGHILKENEIIEVAETNQCLLNGFKKNIHCKGKTPKKQKKHESNTKSQAFEDSVLLLKKKQEKCAKKVIKNLSFGLTFEEGVIGERSPHNKVFHRNNDIRKNLETSIDQRKTTNRKPHSSYYNNRHMPCHLQPIHISEQQGQQQLLEQNSVKKNESNESFCLGVNNSFERLTKIPISDFNNNKNKEEAKATLKATHSTSGWEEHVLSLMSESTANTIVKDYTTVNQTVLKKFMDKRNTPTNVQFNEDTHVAADIDFAEVEDEEHKEHEEKTKNKKQFVKPMDFADLITLNNQKVPKEYETRLQKSYPLPSENWSSKAETKSRMLSKRGIHKWADYPAEIKVQ